MPFIAILSLSLSIPFKKRGTQKEIHIERSTEIRQRSTEINNGFMEKKPMMRYNQ